MKRAAVKAFCERQRTGPGLLDAMITRTDNPHDGPFETVELMLLVQALQMVLHKRVYLVLTVLTLMYQ